MKAIRIGPHVHVGKDYPLLTCTGCTCLEVAACIGERGKTGWEYHCIHPTAPSCRFIGWEGDVETPPWCPELKANKPANGPSVTPDESKASRGDVTAKGTHDAP
jgi:hypothetical protein